VQEDNAFDLNYHVFLASLGFKPSETVTIHGDLTYTMNEGSFSPIVWSGIDPEAITTLVASGQWDYDFTGVDGLSNVENTTWTIGAGADIAFAEGISLYSLLNYSRWEDDDFILVDGTGDYVIGTVGLAFAF
jgi:opacity protein-like surface antigen